MQDMNQNHAKYMRKNLTTPTVTRCLLLLYSACSFRKLD